MKSIIFVLIMVSVAVAVGCSSTGGTKLPDDATASQIFAAAEALRQEGRLDAAADLYERIYDDFPGSDEAVAAQWLAAEIEFEQGNWKSARAAYQEFHKANPMRQIGEIETRMYSIGEALYEDGKSGLFGLGLFPSREQAVQTMLWISTNLDKGPLADDALIFAARSRLETTDEEDAVMYLEELLTRYPESEWHLEARYLSGVTHLRMNRGPAYDLGALNDARRAFTRYIAELERDPAKKLEYADRLAEARENIVEIDNRIAAKNLLIAEYYLEVERMDAARLYLERTARDYPQTDAGRDAGLRLESLSTGAE